MSERVFGHIAWDIQLLENDIFMVLLALIALLTFMIMISEFHTQGKPPAVIDACIAAGMASLPEESSHERNTFCTLFNIVMTAAAAVWMLFLIQMVACWSLWWICRMLID